MHFPTTHWSVLAQATLHGEAGAQQALEELCHRYWSPLKQYIRLRGYDQAEAEDLTQEFLLHLLEHSTLEKADPQVGRFRSFLLGALARFLADHYDKRQALKRGGGAQHLSIEAERKDIAADFDPGELAFDREWALVILENAFRGVQADFQPDGAAPRFEVLRRFLPGALEVPTYEQAAAQLGLSLPALKSELHRLRQRFKALIRQEIANTVSAPHEIDAEMEHLQQVLMHRGNDLAGSLKPSAPVS
jgi:DNA-directed RNA polymerase specialized sigma24 family protein